MAKAPRTKKSPAEPRGSNPLQLRKSDKLESEVHVYGKKFVCDTEDRGHPTPRGRSPLRIVVDASEGFVPLWAQNTTLRWRFNERSMRVFANPPAAKNYIENLLAESLLLWGNAAPVKFAKRDDAWDFEIVVRRAEECDANGCVLASAFFPDSGRHQLTIYPTMFSQTRKEQVETLLHEIGHVFGLRHFFADVSETEFPSEIFGKHSRFSIMNYGSDSVLTPDDKADLTRLYQLAWSGQISQINGTPIRFVRPFHTIGEMREHVGAAMPVAVPMPVPVPAAVEFAPVAAHGNGKRGLLSLRSSG
jgi:hypothetical protein